MLDFTPTDILYIVLLFIALWLFIENQDGGGGGLRFAHSRARS